MGDRLTVISYQLSVSTEGFNSRSPSTQNLKAGVRGYPNSDQLMLGVVLVVKSQVSMNRFLAIE